MAAATIWQLLFVDDADIAVVPLDCLDRATR
jgi:hypothetical protein